MQNGMEELSILKKQYYPIFCHISYWHRVYRDEIVTRTMIRAFASTISIVENKSPYVMEELIKNMYEDISTNYNYYVTNDAGPVSEFAEIPKSKLTDKELEQKLDMCFAAIVSYILDAKSKSSVCAINDEPIKVMLETIQLMGILNPQLGIYIEKPSEYMEKYFFKYYDIVCPSLQTKQAEKRIRHEIDGVVFYTIGH